MPLKRGPCLVEKRVHARDATRDMWEMPENSFPEQNFVFVCVIKLEFPCHCRCVHVQCWYIVYPLVARNLHTVEVLKNTTPAIGYTVLSCALVHKKVWAVGEAAMVLKKARDSA